MVTEYFLKHKSDCCYYHYCVLLIWMFIIIIVFCFFLEIFDVFVYVHVNVNCYLNCVHCTSTTWRWFFCVGLALYKRSCVFLCSESLRLQVHWRVLFYFNFCHVLHSKIAGCYMDWEVCWKQVEIQEAPQNGRRVKSQYAWRCSLIFGWCTWPKTNMTPEALRAGRWVSFHRPSGKVLC